eukprot:Lankesteria_metandrocarpae@DN713_c0_g1_i1.p1
MTNYLRAGTAWLLYSLLLSDGPWTSAAPVVHTIHIGGFPFTRQMQRNGPHDLWFITPQPVSWELFGDEELREYTGAQDRDMVTLNRGSKLPIVFTAVDFDGVARTLKMTSQHQEWVFQVPRYWGVQFNDYEFVPSSQDYKEDYPSCLFDVSKLEEFQLGMHKPLPKGTTVVQQHSHGSTECIMRFATRHDKHEKVYTVRKSWTAVQNGQTAPDGFADGTPFDDDSSCKYSRIEPFKLPTDNP